MANATNTTPVSKQAVLMVVIKSLTSTKSGKASISGLFRNADNSVQNFNAYGPVAERLSNFRAGSLLKVSGFSVAKTVNIKDGSGTRDVNDIVVVGFQIDKEAQEANKAAYAAQLAAAAV